MYVTSDAARAAAIAGPYGARRTPASVIIPLTSAAGVTSNAGFHTRWRPRAAAAARPRCRRAARSGCGARRPSRGRASSAVRRRRRGCRGGGRRARARRCRSCSRVAVGRHPVAADDDRVDPPRASSAAAAPSGSTVTGMPASASSQAVSRAPCSSGRVSQREHLDRLARLRLGVDDASAVPSRRSRGARVADREDPLRAGSSARPCSPIARHASRSARRCAAPRPPRPSAASTRSTAQRRLTAVGAPRRCARPRRGRRARAGPERAGDPDGRGAAHRQPADRVDDLVRRVSRSIRLAGSSVWSMISIASPVQATVGTTAVSTPR